MEKIEWIKVESSNIDSVSWKEKVLYVKFTNGSIYSYDDVPLVEYNGLINAKSIGKYFFSHIKQTYHYNRIQ